MDDLKDFIREHKRYMIVGSVFLVLFVFFSVLSFVNTQSLRGQEAEQEEVQEAVQGETQSDEEELVEAQAEADSELPDYLKAKRDSYDSDTKEFIAILSAQLWGINGGSPYITFTDTTYTENTETGDSIVYAYVVNALEKTTVQASDPETIRYTAAVETADDSFFVELTREIATDGTVSYYLTSTAFRASTDLYTSITPSDAYQVSGLNNEVLQLIGNNEAGLNEAVAEYCAQYLPAAKNITWANYITINWETDQIFIPLEEESSAQKLISVVYDRNEETFTVDSYMQS